jgi:hypothetical protein
MTAAGFARLGGLTSIGFAAAAVVGLALWFTGAECAFSPWQRRRISIPRGTDSVIAAAEGGNRFRSVKAVGSMPGMR